jgi:hypothetical protein
MTQLTNNKYEEEIMKPASLKCFELYVEQARIINLSLHNLVVQPIAQILTIAQTFKI